MTSLRWASPGGPRAWHLIIDDAPRAVCGTLPLDGWSDEEPPQGKVLWLCARCSDYAMSNDVDEP